MSVDNKAEFNVLVGKILRMLAEACPAQVKLDAETFNLEAGSYDTPSEIIGLFYDASPQEQFLTDTLQWLVDEGYIRGESNRGYYVATFQTLKLYGSVPNALTN
ncbi:hypothetical protein I5L59_14895 [Pseudomonas moraviensis]|uniref:hypothetical protein n=1 Tax=Pseudomonas TaxID=286 RepID=UPI0018D89F43|nr:MULTISPECIES: hypothetical protein [Pseudomonas]MBH3444862.1 hypothetical protein [Pseudomonas moraviensis]